MTATNLERKVQTFMKRHQLLHQNATVVVGVSGGADSIALLHYLVSIKKQWGLQIIAVSVDHGLRGEESRQDVIFVGELCEKWQIPFIAEKVDVKEHKDDEGTQLAARKLRYQVFERVMSQYEANYLALGHHGDDQVETVIMRMVQHSNPALLQGIPVQRTFAKGEIIRPLLACTKDDIYKYCGDYNLPHREDPSNQSLDYTRNYYRLKVLPLLKEKNPSVHRKVQQLTERLTEDESYLLKQARVMVDEIIHFQNSVPAVSFSIPSFLDYPIALQRRALHLILNYLYRKDPLSISAKHEDDFLALLHNEKANAAIDFPHSLKVTKSYQKITLSFGTIVNADSFPEIQEIHIPGENYLVNQATLSASYSVCSVVETKHTIILPLEASIFPLTVRARRPGDRIKLRGLNGSKKVKDIFIDEKIALTKRNNWPLLVAGDGTILWVIGLKKAELNINKQAMNCLLLEYTEPTI
ncbi:tRNA lysidine(34) synthetase TilS [Gracilibacillus oryzae]|uniref:tRNA(Ile)-lysidine synthase n=1 Tax=Gracilibacillus oryzae TaxID=1672701 RepID=A0A7C8KQ04_9BACI|nr:tRNA lysidine(34) synthetase TilS [Gracilibacillus oryzae]KAB8126452.1 tRNA lysidine(34) synthetase TilS [Gracilibacillus oryzae]